MKALARGVGQLLSNQTQSAVRATSHFDGYRDLLSMIPTALRYAIAVMVLTFATAANAGCGYEGIPEEFRPLDLSEGRVNSLGQPVVGGEAASTRAERECREQQTIQKWYQSVGIDSSEGTETLIDGVQDAFVSGGSIIYRLFASYRRAYDNPYDPKFDAQKWIMANRQQYRISETDLASFGGVGSESEAYALLAKIDADHKAQERLSRMGQPAEIIARCFAALPDIAFALLALGLLAAPLRTAFNPAGSDRSANAGIAN